MWIALQVDIVTAMSKSEAVVVGICVWCNYVMRYFGICKDRMIDGDRQLLRNGYCVPLWMVRPMLWLPPLHRRREKTDDGKDYL